MNCLPPGGDGRPDDPSGRLISSIESAAVVNLLLLVFLTGLLRLVLEHLVSIQARWLDDLISALLLWFVMIGSAVAAGHCRHLRVQGCESWLPPPLAKATRRLSFLAAALVSLMLAWHGLQAVLMEFEFNQLAFGRIPVWVVQLIVPIGFVVMSARFGAIALSTPISVSEQHHSGSNE